MYKTAVPIHINERTSKDDVLSTLESVGAEYVFLAFDNIILSAEREKYERTFASVSEMIPLLKSRGYKVGIWFWSLCKRVSRPYMLYQWNVCSVRT